MFRQSYSALLQEINRTKKSKQSEKLIKKNEKTSIKLFVADNLLGIGVLNQIWNENNFLISQFRLIPFWG